MMEKKAVSFEEWPQRLQDMSDLKGFDKSEVTLWNQGDLEHHILLYCPARKSDPGSAPYLCGFGNDRFFYLVPGQNALILHRRDIQKVVMETELLNASLSIYRLENDEVPAAKLNYVSAAHDYFDPLIRALFGKEPGYSLFQAAHKYPRPDSLLETSLVMYNQCLPVYLVADGFDKYYYDSKIHRHPIFPWKKKKEEWLEIDLVKGKFFGHFLGYKSTSTFLHPFDELDFHVI